MARAIWSGAVNFGLVTVPVELYSAIEDHTVHFRQFERGTSDRIRYRRVNERTGKEVDFDDIVKGYDLGDGEYVLVEQEELDEIAPGRSRSIDIEAFVELAEIDPVYFEKSYWLAPSKEEFGKAYGLLVQAMEHTEKAGVARFVMRGREHIAAVRAREGVLTLDTLLFADDLRDPSKELRKLPEKTKAPGKELEMAVSLIDSMTEQWDPDQYHDVYNERVLKLIDDKKAGRKVSVEEEPAEPTKVVDLFDALSRSVEKRRKGSSKKKTPDLSELNKAELDRMARELGIKGRSKMSRAELEKAVGSSRRAS
ncbi:Ku protein [Amycolatopsis sp.]|uniref:non-homologous end joining protein Ku n=1 Tax=Amycolatopsis sp. TaxID=37632 RepID=UPI002CFA88A6|nr:Ku protein [Amycolatopsis sp.]HVV11417.1 Ku protein [Amycolatopsis sp.]